MLPILARCNSQETRFNGDMSYLQGTEVRYLIHVIAYAFSL